MGVLAECRAHYELYLGGLARAQAAVAAGELEEAAAAVELAGARLAALARLAPGVAALRRTEEAGDRTRAAELAELSGLVQAGQAGVEATVAALRDRQARTVAELEDLAGVAGPYAPAPAGSLLLDRNG